MTSDAPQAGPASETEYRMGRTELMVLISAIMALTAMAIDLMLPAFADIRETFGLAEGSSETGRIVTIFLLGLAAGQLFYGPLADRFGRKKTLYMGVAIYLVGAIGSALSPSFSVMLFFRFVWGVGAAGSRVVAVSVIRDRFDGVAMAKAMSQVMAVFVLVPVFAPSVGALIVAVLPWRAAFFFCAFFALAIVLWSLRLRETLKPADRRDLSPGTIARGYAEVSRTPLTFGYTIATVFVQAAFTSYLASSDLVIGEVFDREAQFPIVFGAVAILFGVAAIVNGRIVERLGIDDVVQRAFGFLAIVLTLMTVLTVVSSGRPNFWLFTPLLGLALSSFMFVMPNLNSASMEPVGHIAGSASALTGAVRTAGGAVLGGLFAEQIDDTVTPLVLALVTMTTCAGITVWVVRRKESLRERTRATVLAT